MDKQKSQYTKKEIFKEKIEKISCVLECVLFFLTGSAGIGMAILPLLRYNFELANPKIYLIVIDCISVLILVLANIGKIEFKNRVIQIFFALSALLSVINIWYYVTEIYKLSIIIFVLIYMVCAFIMTIKYGKPRLLKLISLGLSVALIEIIILPIMFFGFISWLFGGFGKTATVKTVESPSGAYYAEVVDGDQGALGGNTYVNVYKNIRINALIFKIYKAPERVYEGRWGEFEYMVIYWKNDKCLVINSTEYEIGNNKGR